METTPPVRKVTMNLPVQVIEQAMQATGASLTETTRLALEELARRKAVQDLLDLQGKIKFSMSWQELKALDDE